MRAVIFLFLIFVSVSAIAQDESVPSKASVLEDLLNSGSQKEYRPLSDPDLYKDVPIDYLREAQVFYEECQSDSRLFQFHDCQCMSVAYLDERLVAGPDRSKNSIILSLQRACKDGTYAAGLEYERCMTSGSLLFSKNKAPEEYCACFGNRVGTLYERGNALPGTHSYIRLKAQAHVDCQ